LKNEINIENAIRRAVHLVRVMAEVDWAFTDEALRQLHRNLAPPDMPEEEFIRRADDKDPELVAAVLRMQVGRIVADLRTLAANGAALNGFVAFEEAVQAATRAFLAPGELDAEAAHAVLVGVGPLTPEALGLLPAVRHLAEDTKEPEQPADVGAADVAASEVAADLPGWPPADVDVVPEAPEAGDAIPEPSANHATTPAPVEG
jgi:hypothetical protein